MNFVVSPKSVDEAVNFLVEHPEARPMSGGASLVAMKNARLIDASHFVSLANIDGLRGIGRVGDSLRIGGMTRHSDIATCDLLKGDLEMIRLAAGQIANSVIRNMGTMGGAIGNADPAADYLPVLACADGEVEITGPDGVRRLPVLDYVLDWYETALELGEIVTAVFLPSPKEARSVYRKLARTPGDYAIASVACCAVDQGVRVAVGACGPRPLRSREAEATLAGKMHDVDAIAEFGQALRELADPLDDVRGSSQYRLQLIPRMVSAAIADVMEPV